MKKIEKDELYQNLSEFLTARGIQLTEGPYAQTLQKSCRMLADIVNLGQQGLETARTGIETKIDQVRQAIHQKTAPKPPREKPAPPAAEPAAPQPERAPASAAASAEGVSCADATAPSTKTKAIRKAGAKRQARSVAAKTKTGRKPKT